MGWRPQIGSTVVDASGTHYVLAEEIGSGGQGVVFTTQAEGAAVKISTHPNAHALRPLLEAQIQRVARLPLDDLPVAAPRHLLTGGVVGYTMTMLTGMMALGSLGRGPLVPFDEGWFVRTGGLEKRLQAIEALAELISTLHGRGLVYCDLSANNVLVSASPDRARLHLIDLDNLRSTDASPKHVFTPEFGAPEVKESGATQLTDRFSLAIVAFHVLAAANPFYGKDLDRRAPEDYGDVPWASVAPWIDDPDDSSNRWPNAVDRALTISPGLTRLFGAMFTVGRRDPTARPPAAAFAAAARRALHAVVTCEMCGWQSYINRPDCDSCGSHSRDRAVLRLYTDGHGQAISYRACPVVSVPRVGRRMVAASAVGLCEPPGLPGLRVTTTASGWRVDTLHEDLAVDQRDHGHDDVLVVRRRNRPPLFARYAAPGPAS